MSVHQLKDGRWIVRHPPGTDPERPSANKTYFGRGEEGEALARSYDAAIKSTQPERRQRNPIGANPPFTQLANIYLVAKQHTIAASTRTKCINRMRYTILPEIGEVPSLSITPSYLDRYVKTRTATGVKLTTVHREITDIRAVLKFAVKRGALAYNPMDGFEMPARDNAIIAPPTEAEFAAILAQAVPHLQRAMLISYHTGLRPGMVELSRLRWEHVDFHGRTLMVTSAVKGGMPSRSVPLNATILAHLVAWYKEDEREGVPYLVHFGGGPIDSLRTAWKNAKRRAMVTRRLRLYDIRHAFATRLLASGANLKAVSEILGHSTPELTLRVYQHVDSDLKRQAVEILDLKN